MKRSVLLFLSACALLVVSCKTAPEQLEGTVFSLLSEDFPVVRIERGGFSPNGDGRFDTIDIYPEIGRQEELESWSVEVEDSDGRIVRSYRGDSPVADRITWDGLSDSSQPADEGIYKARFQARFGPDHVYEAETAPFVLALDGPEVTLTIDDGAFSPDGDGIDDEYILGISVPEPKEIESWEILVRDPEGTPFYLRKEIGAPPEEWVWDGRGAQGNTALSGADYPIRLTVKDLWGNETVMNWQVHVDVLVISEGERFIISLSRIIFQPYTADFINVEESERLSNEKTLDQVAQILTKYEKYNVTLVGHGVHVYWFRPDAMQREQEKILLPLSLARATAIRDALVERGIPAERMAIEGRGGSEPLVPHSDLTNRWKNRRVVFYLTP